jgi:transposase
VTDWRPEELWRAYMQLTEAEAAFRIQKTDLQLRPIWHQKQERVEAHILVCFLAFVLWKTLAQLCQRAGLATNREKYSRSWRTSPWSTLCYQRETE